MGSDQSSISSIDASYEEVRSRPRQCPNRRRPLVPPRQRNSDMSSSPSAATGNQRRITVDRHLRAIPPDTFADRMARLNNTRFEGMEPEYFSPAPQRESYQTTPKRPIIFSPNYDIRLDGLEHVISFDTTKWSKICKYLLEAGVFSWSSVTAPEEASEEELLMVHTREYLNQLKVKSNLARITENPLIMGFPMAVLNRCILKPLLFQTKGSILAGELALKNGWAINLGGGFHHASSEEGGGFCIYADISLCVHYVFKNCGISRVLIIDLDSHQGNGIEKDFIGDERVYIMDIYNASVYPQDDYAEGCNFPG